MRLGRFRSYVSSLRLSTKITAFLYITSFLIFLSMELFVYFSAVSVANDDMISDGVVYCSSGASIARNACSYIKGIANYSSSEIDLQNTFSSFQGNVRSETELIGYLRTLNYVLNIVLYTPSGSPVQYMVIDGSSGPVHQGSRRSFRSFMSGSSDWMWEFVDEGSPVLFKLDNSPKLSLWMKIYSAANSRVLGVLCISIDIRHLLTFDVPYTASYSRDLYIIDAQSGRSAVNKSPYPVDEDKALRLLSRSKGNSGHFFLTEGGDETLFIYERITDTPLYLYNEIPVSALEAYVADIRRIILLTTAIYILLFIPLITVVSRWLTKPLNKLRQSMNAFSDGDFSIRLSFNTDDEIGMLGKAFNNMVEKNQQLIEEKYVAQIKTREAELLLQQAQIDPHFMYNLLNGIQWSAMRRGDLETADTAYALAQVLRISLNKGNGMIPVSKECAITMYYLTLEKKRLKDNLEFSIECSREAESTIIPKLIIQPLVENSIKHGYVSGRVLRITVSVSVSGARLVIAISDNGSGIPRDVLRQLPCEYTSESVHSSGFAMRNIHDRLALLYGSDFVFRIDSKEGEGTSISLEMPVKTEGNSNV